MGLKVIGAGPGRTATLTMKLALEKLGFGPCYHMTEMMRHGRAHVPLWQDVADGKPNWDKIFQLFHSTTDYPASCYWKELSEYYPDAKVLLTVRDPNSWFKSINETIMSEHLIGSLGDSQLDMVFKSTYLRPFGENVFDREFMIDWYQRFNEEVIDTIDKDRLLVFHPKEGWAPLCKFLGADVPDADFPRVNSQQEFASLSRTGDGRITDLSTREQMAKDHLSRYTCNR